MGVCCTICRLSVPVRPVAVQQCDTDEVRMQAMIQINKKKQMKVPMLDLSNNPLFQHRKSRNSSKMSSCAVSRLVSLDADNSIL